MFVNSFGLISRTVHTARNYRYRQVQGLKTIHVRKHRLFLSTSTHRTFDAETITKNNGDGMLSSLDLDPNVAKATEKRASASSSSTSSLTKRPITLNIYVDPSIMKHLNMKSNERKARVYITQDVVNPPNTSFLPTTPPSETGEFNNMSSDSDIPATPTTICTIPYIKGIVEKKLISLQRQPYVLRYSLSSNVDVRNRPGTISNQQLRLPPRQFVDDDEVITVLSKALEENVPISLFIEPSPGIFPPPAHSYLEGMADPAESESFTILSFYRFSDIANTQKMADDLLELWKPFRATGRVYVATEGINAQMAIPTNVVKNFKEACETLPLFRDLYLNADHVMTRKEFEDSKPFKALHIRIRDQIVADGFSESLDWQKSGKEMHPMEWHEQLDNPNAIILDCRNSYESDVGTFQGAIPLNTTFFRESWDALDEILKDKEKDAPIMTFCTGGIRCVKINAYLEQKLGFTNVNRLQGGIIGYTRELETLVENVPVSAGQGSESENENDTSLTTNNVPKGVSFDDTGKPIGGSSMQAAEPSIHYRRNVAESKFKGVNYVFDERMGARVTTDVLSACETCGTACDSFTNCENFHCHIRFIQCATCRTSYSGSCSLACQQEHAESLNALEQTMQEQQQRQQQQKQLKLKKMNKRMQPRSQALTQTATDSKTSMSKVIDMSDAITSTDKQPTTQTHATTLTSSLGSGLDHAFTIDHALSEYCEMYSTQEPSLLKELREETNRVYDPLAARMVSGPLQGRILSTLTSLTRASKVLELGTFTGYATLCFAEGLLSTMSPPSTPATAPPPHEKYVVTCEIDSSAADLAQSYFDKSEYGHVIKLLRMKASDCIAQVRAQSDKFDVVFIDADKKAYYDYLVDIIGDESAGRPCLLNPGAIIIVDNTLWKGLVLEQSKDTRLSALAPDAAQFGNPSRMKALAAVMHNFNTLVASRSDLQPIMLPLRDGLTVIRYTGASKL